MWHDLRHIAAMNQRQTDEMVQKRSLARIAMAGLPLLAGMIPGFGWAQDAAEDAAMAAYRDKTQVVRPCRRDPGTIVVCGSRAERNARERIPLPEERDAAQGGIVRNEAPRASAAPVRKGACGVEGGQGTGCVGGLPVLQGIMLLGKIGAKILDPDADTISEPGIPDRYKGATPP